VHNTSTQALLMIVSNINKDRLADSPGYSLWENSFINTQYIYIYLYIYIDIDIDIDIYI
jgi:hypothetical protein